MIFRGATVEFSTTIRDTAGETVIPDVAQVIISYPSGTHLRPQRSSTTLILEQSDDDYWVASWDSSVASPGTVYWSLKALRVEDPLVTVDDGQFCLKANTANSPDSIAPESTILTTEDGDALTTEDGDKLVTA